MRRPLLALVILALTAAPAAAYDPEAKLAPGHPLDPHQVAAQEGLHRVSEVYHHDQVTHDGERTTYSTVTEHRAIDTYARALETVRTGEASPLDGAAFNGRGALSTGEGVAGTFYEDYLWNGERFVPANIVFFQDDSELLQQGGPDAAATVPDEPPGPVTPGDRLDAPTAPAGEGPDRQRPDSPRPRPDPSAMEIGLDPTGGAALRDTLEVSRGARYAFAVNVRGAPPLALDAWELVDGANDAWNAAGWHAAADRLSGAWLRLPSANGWWPLTVRVRVQPVSGGAAFEAEGRVRILVRSPAVVE